MSWPFQRDPDEKGGALSLSSRPASILQLYPPPRSRLCHKSGSSLFSSQITLAPSSTCLTPSHSSPHSLPGTYQTELGATLPTALCLLTCLALSLSKHSSESNKTATTLSSLQNGRLGRPHPLQPRARRRRTLTVTLLEPQANEGDTVLRPVLKFRCLALNLAAAPLLLGTALGLSFTSWESRMSNQIP